MNVRDVTMAIRQRWWVLVLCVVLGGLAGVGFAVLPSATYTSTARVVVAVPGVDQNALQLAGGLSVTQRATNYANLATGTEVLSGVIKDLGLHSSVAQLTKSVTVDVPMGTTVLQIAANAPTAEGAQQIAQAVAEQLSKSADSLETALGVANAKDVLLVADPAPLPPKADPAGTAKKGALGIIVGLIIGAGVLWFLEYLDGSVRRPEDLAEVTTAPVLGTVDRNPAGPLPASGAAAEPFRTIRTALPAPDSGSAVMVVAGVTDRDHSARVAANLGSAYALAGRSVLVVDADLHDGALGDALGVGRGTGLADALAAASTPSLADLEIGRWEAGRCDVLTAGATSALSGDLLTSPRLGQLLGALRDRYDVIMVSAPAALASVAATTIGTAADGVILVATWGKTSLAAAKHASDRVTMASASLAGSVVVGVPHFRSARDASFVPAPR